MWFTPKLLGFLFEYSMCRVLHEVSALYSFWATHAHAQQSKCCCFVLSRCPRHRSTINVEAHTRCGAQTHTPCIWTSHVVSLFFFQAFMPSCNISDGVCLVFFFVFLLFFFLCLCVSLACFLPPAFFISFPSLLLLLALSCTLGANQKYAHTNTVNFLFSSCVPLRLLG